MCLGDTVVFTCVAIGIARSAVWRGDKGTTRVLDSITHSGVVNNFTINLTEIIGDTVVSTATVQTVTLLLNGSSISCGNGINSSLIERVVISG